MAMVDWQLCRYLSPAIDLVYNIFTSTDKALRDSDYENLLKHYHLSLSNTIERLGSDPERLFSYNDLQNELKRYGKFGVIMAPALLRVMLADPKDIRNYEDLGSPEEEEKHVRTIGISAEDTLIAYRKRLIDLTTDIVNFGYL